MIYGQTQYFDDEVSTWLRSVAYHKGEIKEAVRQLTTVLNFPVLSLPDTRTCELFMDQLIVQEKQLDFLASNISIQGKRLMLAVDGNNMASSVSDPQVSLRWKMCYYEHSFIKTKHDCSAFISSFFELDSLALRA